jgi:hypothetical protein
LLLFSTIASLVALIVEASETSFTICIKRYCYLWNLTWWWEMHCNIECSCWLCFAPDSWQCLHITYSWINCKNTFKSKTVWSDSCFFLVLLGSSLPVFTVAAVYLLCWCFAFD